MKNTASLKRFILPLLFFSILNSCIQKKENIVTFGIIADIHQDLQPNARERLQIFLDSAQKVNPDFIIQLGDLSHGITPDSIIEIWNQYPGKNYHVLGNHDSDNLTKEDILKKQNMPGQYYSYDIGDIHFIVLDLNYIIQNGEYKDFEMGNNYYVPANNKNLISAEQLEWLEKDLLSTNKPTIIFSHQGIGEIFSGSVSPSNKDIRKVFAQANAGSSKKVIACFAGDQHTDTYEEIDGIHYFQINSASYFWIGESATFSNGHMAEYKESLFAFVTIDLENKTIEVQGTESVFLEPAPIPGNYSKPEKLRAGITTRKINY